MYVYQPLTNSHLYGICYGMAVASLIPVELVCIPDDQGAHYIASNDLPRTVLRGIIIATTVEPPISSPP